MTAVGVMTSIEPAARTDRLVRVFTHRIRPCWDLAATVTNELGFMLDSL